MSELTGFLEISLVLDRVEALGQTHTNQDVMQEYPG
jgi:hypothetical protein